MRTMFSHVTVATNQSIDRYVDMTQQFTISHYIISTKLRR